MTVSSGKTPAAESFRLLFYRTDETGAPQPPHSAFLRHIEALLAAELPADRAFQLNALARFGGEKEFAAAFLGEIFDCCVANGVLPDDYASADFSAEAEYIFSHASQIMQVLPQMIPDLPGAVLPRAKKLFDALPESRNIAALAQGVLGADPFSAKRVFTSL